MPSRPALQQRRAAQLDLHVDAERRVRASRWGHLKRILLAVFVYCDTTTIRAQMALASIAFAVGCIPDALWPNSVHLFSLAGWDIHTPAPLGVFDRPLYAGMRAVAPGWVWGLGFLAHAIGVVWRFLDTTRRVYWALAINALGSGLWFLSTALMTWQVGEFVPSVATEWVMVGALIVALVRTGLNEEKVSP